MAELTELIELKSPNKLFEKLTATRVFVLLDSTASVVRTRTLSVLAWRARSLDETSLRIVSNSKYRDNNILRD